MNPFFDSLKPDFKPMVTPAVSKAILASRSLKRRKTRRSKKKKHKFKSAEWQRERDEALFEQRRIKQIPFMPYKLYMGSAYWKKRKLDYFEKHGRACAVCGTEKDVTLHHKVYNDKLNGNEPDDVFAPLCQYHHQLFHDTHPLNTNMRKATDRYIRTMQQALVSGGDDLSWIK